MPTAPTRVSFAKIAFNVGGSPRSSASISWQTGDVIVVIGGGEGQNTETLGNPTATGLTFTTQKSHVAASNCESIVAAAVAASSGSGTISMTNSDTNSSTHWGFGVWVYRNSDGIGNSSEQHTSTRTVALTPTAPDSAIVWGIFDWAAASAQSGTPTPTTTDENGVDSGKYTSYLFDLTDQTSAGSVSYGISGSSGSGPWTIVVFEIKGSNIIGTKLNIRQAVKRSNIY